MNIYALKNKIKNIQALNDPKQRYWLEFLQDLYYKELQAMADKVTQELSQEQKEKSSWAQYLAN
jgi:glucose-6-phosphate 1-dehydrogenase